MHATMKLGGSSRGHTWGEGRTPILSVSGAEHDGLTLASADPDTITPDELRAVRSLRAAVERFAAECERIATEQGVPEALQPADQQDGQQ